MASLLVPDGASSSTVMGLAITPGRSTEILSSPEAQDQSGKSADEAAIQPEVQSLSSAPSTNADDNSIVTHAHAMSRDNAMRQAHTEPIHQATEVGEATRSEQIANTELAPSQPQQADADRELNTSAHSKTEEPISACVSHMIESIEENDSKTTRGEEMQSSPPPTKSNSSSNKETCAMCCVPLDDNTGICDECQDIVAVDMSDDEYQSKTTENMLLPRQ